MVFWLGGDMLAYTPCVTLPGGFLWVQDVVTYRTQPCMHLNKCVCLKTHSNNTQSFYVTPSLVMFAWRLGPCPRFSCVCWVCFSFFLTTPKQHLGRVLSSASCQETKHPHMLGSFLGQHIVCLASPQLCTLSGYAMAQEWSRRKGCLWVLRKWCPTDLLLPGFGAVLPLRLTIQQLTLLFSPAIGWQDNHQQQVRNVVTEGLRVDKCVREPQALLHSQDSSSMTSFSRAKDRSGGIKLSARKEKMFIVSITFTKIDERKDCFSTLCLLWTSLALCITYSFFQK